MEWATDDPLGIGGLLFDASRIAQLIMKDVFSDVKLLGEVLEAGLRGLEAITVRRRLEEPPGYRLPFRKLGLSIGAKAASRLSDWALLHPAHFGQRNLFTGHAEALAGYLPLAEKIESFWLNDRNRTIANWSGHREINMLMLASSLDPGEFLTV